MILLIFFKNILPFIPLFLLLYFTYLFVICAKRDFSLEKASSRSNSSSCGSSRLRNWGGNTAACTMLSLSRSCDIRLTIIVTTVRRVLACSGGSGVSNCGVINRSGSCLMPSSLYALIPEQQLTVNNRGAKEISLYILQY